MDRKQRSAVFPFWRRVFFSLIVFSISYLSVIRPTQKWIVDKLIFPNVYHNYTSNQDIKFSPGTADEIIVINQVGLNSVRTKLELPFNGHILLALTLLIASGNKNFIRFLVIYQVLLFFIIPLLGWLLINGQNWLSVVLNFHEKAHKAAFLIMGLLSIKSKADSVSAGKILNK